MIRILMTFGATVVVLCSSSPAAIVYNFAGSQLDGTGTATMTFDGLGTNEVTVTIQNTSPLALNAPADGPNAPGISGMGFNLPGLVIGDLADWSLTAFEWDGADLDELTIGAKSAPTLDWAMDTNVTGDITLDFLPNNGGNADGMIYNPAAVSLDASAFPGGGNDVYFSLATLVLTFEEDVKATLDDTDEYSPFIRMQRVGINAGGSLKLGGYLDDGDGGLDEVVPEPASLAVWSLGIALLGLFWHRRKRV